MVLLDNSCKRTAYSDSVATHNKRMILLIFVLIYSIHSLRILCSKLKYLSNLDAASVLYWGAADWARVTLLENLEVCNYVTLVISSVVHVENVVV